VKRMIRVLAVATLVAVILVASMSPALARRGNFGHRMPTNRPCEVTRKAQNEGGAHHEVAPFDPSTGMQREGCWVVLPGQG
jgi:hypothetical protein